MAKAKRKSESIALTITKEQYQDALAEYSANDKRLNSIAAEIEEEIQAIKEEFGSDINILQSKNQMLMSIIKGYCVTNRDSMFEEGKKSTLTIYGTVGFRKDPPSMQTKGKVKWEEIVPKLKELLPAYVRSVEEADKVKLLADRDKEDVNKHFPAIGIKVKQDEAFYIELIEEVPA
jgi:phage host-nuclease inhibitor protein Gam